jgi:sugar lactone lactonase YvrE
MERTLLRKRSAGAAGLFAAAFLAFALCPGEAPAGSKTWTLTADFKTGQYQNTNSNIPDQVDLNKGQAQFVAPYLFVSNSPDNTVGKLDTDTGSLVAVYRDVCWDPSRTAVDLEQYGYVACRGNGTVAKLDKESDQVLWRSRPDAFCNVARALAIDKSGGLWVGLWDCNKMVKLDRATGSVLATVTGVDAPYGAAADSLGNVYVADGQFWEPPPTPNIRYVTKINSTTNQVVWKTAELVDKAPYGIAVDDDDNPWIASWQGQRVFQIDRNSGAIIRDHVLPLSDIAASDCSGAGGCGAARGIAVDQNGYIWVAMSCNCQVNDGCGNRVAKIDPVTAKPILYVTQAMDGPVGVAVDSDNNIWAINRSCEGSDCSVCNKQGTAVKIRSTDGAVLGSYSTGGRNPYTYSDMTGAQLQRIAPEGRGTWSASHDLVCAPAVLSISWTAVTPGGSTITVRGRVGPAPGSGNWEYVQNGGSLSSQGRYLDIVVEFYSPDSETLIPSLKDITVNWQPTAELCDNQDNDCDGTIDNQTRPCSTICGSGTETCVAGQWVNCAAQQPKSEECNCKDDDCDKVADNTPAGGWGACTAQTPNACKAGTYECKNCRLECVPNQTPKPEECNGVDDDCDGTADNGNPGGGKPCATGQPGICAFGTTKCDGGKTVCIPDENPSTEKCDGLDNNCNGMVDEGTRNACGLCGEVPDEECNGLDDDCDGAADDGAECGDPAKVCINGECVGRCVNNECPSGKVCKTAGSGGTGYYCLSPCSGVRCDPPFLCDEGTGTCYDPCRDKQCETGKRCMEGNCVAQDCHESGCPEGMICAGGMCKSDPCWMAGCAKGSVCESGKCEPSCAAVSCPVGKSCKDGVCIDDPCSYVSCPPGKHCVGGGCQDDPCATKNCGTGYVCVDAECKDDPCLVVKCPDGQVCRGGECFYENTPVEDGGFITPDGGGGGDGGLEKDVGIPKYDGGTANDDSGHGPASDAGTGKKPKLEGETAGCSCAAVGI